MKDRFPSDHTRVQQMKTADPNQGVWPSSLKLPKLSNADFKFFSKLIYDKAGIDIPLEKKSLMENRLGKRLLALKLTQFSQYKQLLQGDAVGKELVLFTNSLTTNKTEFFRESLHFSYLKDLLEKHASNRMITLWSAASSSGEEAYTMAMMCEELAKTVPLFDYRILGTDIDTQRLQMAERGIYDIEAIANIPSTFQHEYFEAEGAQEQKQVKIGKKLRQRLKFRHHNLVEYGDLIPLDFDIIFLRNVLFYFDAHTAQQIVAKLVSQLKPGGFLFIGLTEKLHKIDPQLTYVESSIYQKKV